MNKKVKYLFLIVYIIIITIFYLWLHSNNDNSNIILFIFLALFIGIITFCLFLFIENNYQDKNIHFIFALIASILGFSYIFLAPLFTGSDEHNHFYRIYEISEFKFVSPTNDKNVGSELPVSLSETFLINHNNEFVNSNTNIKYADIKNKIKVPLNKNNITLYGTTLDYSKNYANTSLYSPIQYLPQVVGLSIGKLVNFSPYILGMIARIFNLAFYIIISTIGLKLLPKNKIFATCLLLCPVALSNASTMSADGFAISVIFLYIAYILNIIYSKKLLVKKDYCILVLLSLIISTIKIVYLPLVFLLLLIPKANFKKNKNIFILIVILIAIIINLLWNLCTSSLFDLYYQNSSLQIEYIFNNLLSYIFITLKTYLLNFYTYLEDMVIGSFMYHAQIKVFSFISFAYLTTLFLSAMNNSEKNIINNKNKIIASIIGFIVICLISTALYVQCTANFVDVGNLEIIGIQGRYFIPIILLLPFILPKTKKLFDNKNIIQAIILISLPVFLTMIISFI